MTLYRFFPHHELACKCGCGYGETVMSSVYMTRLIQLRKAFGKPMPLSSAFRCPAHNKKVSKTGAFGSHTTGHAVDVRISGHAAHELLSLAFAFGFTGIGLHQRGKYGQRFIHLDDLEGPERPWVWTY